MKNLMLRGVVVGPVQTNCYFLKNKETQEILIVDPGAEPDRIIQALFSLEGKPAGILLTNGHFDHIEAAKELQQHYQIPVYAAAKEEKILQDTALNLSAGWSGKPCSVKVDTYLEDGEVFTLGGFEIRMILSPGHTEGSCCYWLPEEQVCLTGDTIFCGSCGRTDLPTGSMRQMKESLHKVLELLPEETELFPGHGEQTDAAFEKMHNPYL